MNSAENSMPGQVVNEEVAGIVDEHDLTPASERTESMPPATHAAVIKDSLQIAGDNTATASERARAMQTMVQRLQKVTGDESLNADRVARKLHLVHIERRRKRTGLIGRLML